MPDLNEQVQAQQAQIDQLERLLSVLIASDRYTVQKDIQMFDGRNIQVAKGTGSSIGTETTQKLSVYGVTPVIQASNIANPTGGMVVDAEARTAIDSILTAIEAFGITAA